MVKAKRFKKGSPEAKAFMAKLRKMKGKKTTSKKVGATKKTTPKKRVLSMHKDTKSHNVNIRVVSGTNDFYIERLKKASQRLFEFDKILKVHKSKKLKDRTDLDKLMIKKIPLLIKNEKELIRIFKKHIK
jgi:hypothetical protein